MIYVTLPDASDLPGPDFPGIISVAFQLMKKCMVFEPGTDDDQDNGQEGGDEGPPGTEDQGRTGTQEKNRSISGMIFMYLTVPVLPFIPLVI